MLLNFTDISSVKKAVEVEIPAQLIERESDRVATEFARQARIPGFRPGKVPARVARTRFAKEIQEEVMSRLLPLTFREAIAGRNLDLAGDPHLEHVDTFVEGAPVKYKAEFEVKPHFELAEWRGLEVDDPKIEVADADVDAMIDRLREQASAYRPETERGLQDGDYAIIEIASTPESGEVKTDSGHFRMGEESPMPELQEQLFGRRPGETVSFEKVHPEDAQQEAWRGVKVRHEVTLKEIRVQEKPEVNADFARSVGGWESVEEMRERIAADIRRHREHEAMRMKRNQLGDRLVAAHDFEVPAVLIDEELNKSMNNYARFLASQGVDLRAAEIDWQKVGDEFKPEAVKRVKRTLILEAIARRENIQVSDVEVDAEIRRAAQEAGRDFPEVKHQLRHDGGYEALRASLAADRAMELVLRESKAKG